MIRKAIEGGITWLPGIAPSDIPHPLPKGITVHLKEDEVGLEIQGLVGALPLRNRDTLQISPKIGQVNFFRLLFKAEGHQQNLEREFDAFVEYSIEDDENIDAIVARQQLYCAEEILKRSPQCGRFKIRHVGLYAAGQIDAVSTALNISCRKHEPVVFFAKEKTEDIPENRVITEAIARAWPLLNEPSQFELRSVYEKWMRRFPRSNDLGVDIENVEKGFARGKYGGPRDYYRKALMLAKIVLGNNGIGFNEAATVEGDAVLLNTADIFEKYLRNVISGAYSDTGFIITKGGVGVTSLYTDGSFELQPDIVISRDGHTLLIADAKYKVPTADDHYQMNTYLAVNGVSRGLLLSPLFEGNNVVIREFSTADKVVVREVYLPMTNLKITEEFLGTVIGKSV